jgi:formate hydrogenlyase subunit 6/NADH:ubiquinone oxidoreductase subunit I
MQYTEGITINEGMLFCKLIKRRATAKELFKIVVDFMKEKCVKWSHCVGVCTDAACVMAGNKRGLKALIKRSAPEATWTHCMIHCESPAMKE